MTATCQHCGSEIEQEGTVGWVDVTSGDDGGTYDICPDSPTRKHQPVEEAAVAGHEAASAS